MQNDEERDKIERRGEERREEERETTMQHTVNVDQDTRGGKDMEANKLPRKTNGSQSLMYAGRLFNLRKDATGP